MMQRFVAGVLFASAALMHHAIPTGVYKPYRVGICLNTALASTALMNHNVVFMLYAAIKGLNYEMEPENRSMAFSWRWQAL